VGNPDFKITKNSDFVITYGDLKLWPTKCAITINFAGQERTTFSWDHVSRVFPLVVTSREQSGFGDSWELKIEMGPKPEGRRSNSIYVTREYVSHALIMRSCRYLRMLMGPICKHRSQILLYLLRMLNQSRTWHRLNWIWEEVLG
jgi:hypothetical protein